MIDLDHMIESVASARVALDEANAIHANDTAEVTRLAGRIQQCRTRQGEITSRRLAGQADEKEAAEYAALNGDLDVLRGLLAEAQTRANQSRPDTARAALAHAESELRDAQVQAEFDALVEHAREVERAYIAALGRVWNAARARGHRRTFGEVYSIAQPIMAACRQNYWEAS